MAWFYIAYDLDKPGQNYENLWTTLRQIGGQRVQDSVWLVKADVGTNASQLAEAIRKHMDKNDRLVVIESAQSSWYNLMVNPNAA